MATFLLEVGTEELPASFVDEALEQWRSQIPTALAAAALTPTAIAYYGTPRRLAVILSGLPDQQPDQAEDIKGPPAQAAYKDGQPTKAAIGFAQKQGVAVTDLDIRPTDKGDFIFVHKMTPGQPTRTLLQTLIPDWITGLQGKRFMRWADGDLRFPRPIRSLVALWDGEAIALELANASQPCRSGRTTSGHRVLHPTAVEISHADTYVETLRSAFVEVDPEVRQAKIQQQIQETAQKLGGVAIVSPRLLREVTNLVEWPTPVVGQFDAAFLELPSEVSITEMESHQRYFPVVKTANSLDLLPHFITISNGDPQKAAIIARGNERVIRARLADGKFFFDADRAQALDAYLPKLETVTFQADLGSVRAKADRIVAISQAIGQQLQLKPAQHKLIQRAALLCKADLVTQMVGEFPELQGIMGEKYARAGGEPEAVAVAIAEHYLPKGAGDALPQSLVGQVVGVGDRLDTLVSIFGLGMIPSGSSDPFALRRAANAIVNITWAANLSLNLETLLVQVVGEFAKAYSGVMKLSAAELEQQLREFFLARIRTLLQDEHQVDYDLVNAILGEADPEYAARALQDVLDVRDRALYLQSLRNDGTLATIYATVNRAARLAAQGTLDTAILDPSAVVQSTLFQKASEPALFEALQQVHTQLRDRGNSQGQSQRQGQTRYTSLITSLSQIAPTVSQFFDGADSVMVMDPDPAVQQNRLNLLGVLRNQARVLADFGAIVKA
jgi:glycyl-tRNA synthetase beta chain